MFAQHGLLQGQLSTWKWLSLQMVKVLLELVSYTTGCTTSKPYWSIWGLVIGFDRLGQSSHLWYVWSFYQLFCIFSQTERGSWKRMIWGTSLMYSKQKKRVWYFKHRSVQIWLSLMSSFVGKTKFSSLWNLSVNIPHLANIFYCSCLLLGWVKKWCTEQFDTYFCEIKLQPLWI